MAHTTQPSVPSVLEFLTEVRMVDIGKEFAVLVPEESTKQEQIRALLEAGTVTLGELARTLSRGELGAAC